LTRKLESAWFQPLNLSRDFLVSQNFVFQILNLYRYTESEYQETVNKAAALGRAIDLAEDAFAGDA
jgi:hypothetical protein